MHIVKAEKSDKKPLKRFYKQQGYPASFIGADKSYFIKDNSGNFIAAVILSRVSDVEFLHALCVDKQFRKQKLASKLLKYCHSQYANILCFADAKLEPLYLKNGFRQVNQEAIPSDLKNRWLSYLAKSIQLRIFTNIYR